MTEENEYSLILYICDEFFLLHVLYILIFFILLEWHFKLAVTACGYIYKDAMMQNTHNFEEFYLLFI